MNCRRRKTQFVCTGLTCLITLLVGCDPLCSLFSMFFPSGTNVQSVVENQVIGDSSNEDTSPEARSIAWYWAVMDQVDGPYEWIDPQASLAIYIGPEPGSGPDPSMQTILSFDKNNTLLHIYQYLSDDDVLLIQQPLSFPLIGKVFEVHQDGSMTSGEAVFGTYSDGTIEMQLRINVTVHPNEDGSSWNVEVVERSTVTALTDIPADPVAGYGAILTGDTTDRVKFSTLRFIPSAAPTVRYPGAIWITASI